MTKCPRCNGPTVLLFTSYACRLSDEECAKQALAAYTYRGSQVWINGQLYVLSYDSAAEEP